MIAIIDYGVGNLRSVQNALEKVNFESIITDDIDSIEKSKAIILPGVGAFKDAMDNLQKNGLIDVIHKNAKNNKPILGICLGMQVLYEKGWEDGLWNGLGLLEGEIVEFDNNLKVPHMGWNELNIVKNNNICKFINNNDHVYFVHSYYAKSSGGEVIANSDYGTKVPAIVNKGNIFGMQFHPEKSGKTGLNLLKGFGEMIK